MKITATKPRLLWFKIAVRINVNRFQDQSCVMVHLSWVPGRPFCRDPTHLSVQCHRSSFTWLSGGEKKLNCYQTNPEEGRFKTRPLSAYLWGGDKSKIWDLCQWNRNWNNEISNVSNRMVVRKQKSHDYHSGIGIHSRVHFVYIALIKWSFSETQTDSNRSFFSLNLWGQILTIRDNSYAIMPWPNQE